ncbi:hypothetical protein CO005_00555 [Candidatus Roizmanbacteria bacterium CG_4_8_14_3_um_filter_34_9]|uniref:Uncharacterized protein n=2 Tax=Candidatus Roizmaniibacteriota TaxID=1752723 RepID=A0A2M6YVM9_9BACT|nr:MAG: hypothetical protein COT02_00285 [Candidatus Roizmanbacteria bacterium CG07_land_8_20_14_0_80_34_15]PIW73601.1 MAG: hypothetical protein CO005_00555 [Candidatus Roizmanbacteria bacterium CG_4_8_14_3_um_filter_34_9]
MVDNKFDLNIKDQDGFRKFIEYEAATLIISLLEKGSVDEEKAGKLSQITLDLIIPGMTVEELYLSGVKLDNHDPELAPVVYKIMKIYEEKFEKKAIEQVSAMVKNKQFGQAQDIVKKVLQFKMGN